MKIKPFKIQVNPEQSAEVQKCVFAHGGEWFKKDGCQTVKNTEQLYLTYNSLFNPEKCYLLFSSVEHKQTYEENTATELTYEEFMKLYGEKSVE